jgi:Na+/H+ antiporter NhaD/arsenite permease-like protein
MDLAWISVIALVITVLVSCSTRLNPGVLAICCSWVIVVFIAPMVDQPIALKEVLGKFPAELFLTLTGVTLLFTQAQVNGTLDRIAQAAIRACRGNPGLIPLAFFSLSATVSAVGAGSVATAALVAPMAMAAAGNARVPAFLMVMMVGHGAIAGGMSPFAMTGVIANGLMARMGFPGYAWHNFFHNLAANAFVAITGYLLFGGWRLFRQRTGQPTGTDPRQDKGSAPLAVPGRFEWKHQVTLAVIFMLIVAVVVLHLDVGMAAFVGVAILTLSQAADERETFRTAPWSVILMVCGVTILTSLIERTGGIERIATAIADVSTPRTLPGILGFATGVVSVYSSTSGVVLPAFLPAIPALLERVGGGDPIPLASSINIGANLVDVSPLSTIGALCIACASPTEDRRLLFHQVLAWGLSMSVVGGLLCTLFFAG